MSYVMTIRLPDGATLKRPAREAAGLLEVTVADDDVAGIPDLRADVAELGGEVVTENGSTSPRPGTEVGEGRWCVLLPSKVLATTGSSNVVPAALGLGLLVLGGAALLFRRRSTV